MLFPQPISCRCAVGIPWPQRERNSISKIAHRIVSNAKGALEPIKTPLQIAHATGLRNGSTVA